jgi:hypothetical protein
MRLLLPGQSSINCGGDPVISSTWPLGSPDVQLSVTLVSFTTLQDTAYGSLVVQWSVASETDNAGFVLRRKAETDSSFSAIASYANTPELVGAGTSPSARTYSYTDHNLVPGRSYDYRLESVSIDGQTHAYEIEATGIPRLPPQDFSLGNAYPNPFNSAVTISFVVPRTSGVKLKIYDLLGREVQILVNSTLAASDYHARWDSRDKNGVDLPSGVYFYRLETDQGFFQTKKLLLLR